MDQMSSVPEQFVKNMRGFTPAQYEMAKAGYDGYCRKTDGRSLITGDVLPAFDVLLPVVQDAWCAAAIAIEQHVARGLGLDDEVDNAESVVCPNMPDDNVMPMSEYWR